MFLFLWNQKITGLAFLFQEHQRMHTGETPFECSDCQMKFRTRHMYKRHLKTKHGKQLWRPRESNGCLMRNLLKFAIAAQEVQWVFAIARAQWGTNLLSSWTILVKSRQHIFCPPGISPVPRAVYQKPRRLKAPAATQSSSIPMAVASVAINQDHFLSYILVYSNRIDMTFVHIVYDPLGRMLSKSCVDPNSNVICILCDMCVFR